MEVFTERVIEIIKNIEKGHVMSYGEVATLAGNNRAARQVARILHTLGAKYQLPWHRVVNSQLKISIKDPTGALLQKQLLESEGVLFQGDKIIKTKESFDKS